MTTENHLRVVCTGGLGYIGSHTVKCLVDAGFEPIILDNMSNVPLETPSRIDRINAVCGKSIECHQVDLCDQTKITEVLRKLKPDAVIHFAALKQVGESVAQPLRYYNNNITGLIYLLQAMDAAACCRLLYSGSAAIYPAVETLITEEVPANPASVYGKTKSMGEQILTDLSAASPDWNVVTLRYFNPVGAEPTGRLGDNPAQPLNIFPIIQRTAAGKQKEIIIAGTDWDTPDGTGVRDYIHIEDLANAHVAALRKVLETGPDQPHRVFNIGTGRGYSVREIIAEFAKAAGNPIPTVEGPRRPGDIARCVADPSLAEKELGWKANKTLQDACESAWNYMKANE